MTDQPMSNLHTTQHLMSRLAGHPDQSLVDALVEGFGNLVSFIRNQPTDHPVIDTRAVDPLEDSPITKYVVNTYVVNTLENAMPTYQVRSDVAETLGGATIVAVKALETRIQAIEQRLAGG
jgi:hypothetical protein